MRASYGAAAAVLFLLVSCGSTPSGGSDASAEPDPPAVMPTAMPAEIPVPRGEVRTGGLATVLDDGRHGAQLCLGGVMESLPPQCGGPRLIGWEWERGTYEEAGGTRWGSFVVTGTFDGRDLTVTSVTPADRYDAPPPPEDDPVWHTPCAEPKGGWAPVDPATTTEQAQNEAARVARRLPGFGELWADQSINPAAGEEPSLEMEMAMNDPRFTILNVSVTGDIAAAEAAIREVWGGPLCVSEAEMSSADLRDISRHFADLPGVLGYNADGYPLEPSVIFDDGTIQAWFDREHGAGTVVVHSALEPVG